MGQSAAQASFRFLGMPQLTMRHGPALRRVTPYAALHYPGPGRATRRGRIQGCGALRLAIPRQASELACGEQSRTRRAGRYPRSEGQSTIRPPPSPRRPKTKSTPQPPTVTSLPNTPPNPSTARPPSSPAHHTPVRHSPSRYRRRRPEPGRQPGRRLWPRPRRCRPDRRHPGLYGSLPRRPRRVRPA